MKAFWTRGRRWTAGLSAGLSAGLFLWVAGCEPKAGNRAGADPDSGADGGAGQEEPAVAPEPGQDGTREEPAGPAEPGAPLTDHAPVVEPLPEPAPTTPPKEAWTIAQAGFAAHLPPDIDLYADARELGWLWEMVEQLGLEEKLLEWIQQAGLPLDLGADTINAARETISQGMEREAFVAVRGLGTVLDAAGEISAEMNRIVGREMTRTIAAADFFGLAGEDFGGNMQAELAKWLLRNVEKIGARRDLALYAGGRVPAAKRAELLESLTGHLEGLAEKVEALKTVRWQRGETSWSGVEVRIGEMEGFGEAEAPEDMDEEAWEKLKAEVGSWKIVIAGAEVDEFVVVAAGLGQDAILLAEAPGQSLAGTDPYRFFEKFEADAVRATTWMSKAVVEGAWKWNSYLPMFEGVVEGLKTTPKLLHRDGLVKALEEMNGHWRARRAGVAHDFLSAVLVGEDVRIESRGGWLNAGVDLESPLKFTKAFDAIGAKLFLRAHWKKSAGHVALGKKWLEAGKKFLRLVAEEAMDAGLETAREGNDEDSVANLTRWKRDLLNGIDDFWQGYDEHFSHAFGTEAAFVMDLEGKMIPAVGVEADAVEKGRIPRAAYVRPIVKREALTEAWTLWHRAATNMFGVLAEAIDQPIPFPDTMTAEKDDLRTSFFPFPFASDDFLPSVSVSDELYLLGSSKTLSESLYVASRAADEKVVEPGVRVEMNADPLWEFCEVWLDLSEKRRARREEIEEEELERRLREGDGPAAEDGGEEAGHEHRVDDGVAPALDPETRRNLEDLLQNGDLPDDARDNLRKILEDEARGREERNSLRPEETEEAPEEEDERDSGLPGESQIDPDQDSEPEHEDEDEHHLEEPKRREFNPPPPGPELPGSQRSPQDPPAIPEPSPYLVPEEEIQNPLLRELMQDQNGEVPKIEDGLEFRFDPLKAEDLGMDDALPGEDGDEFGADRLDEGVAMGPSALLSMLPEPEVLRSLLEKARWFRGFTYHRRLEDGVPRSTVKVID